VADMISAYDGIRWGPGIPRQFQYEQTQKPHRGSIWQYPLRFIENSPIFTADRVSTPLLMIHNDADDAVPWYQGIEYFLALRRLGKEAYLFGLQRRAAWIAQASESEGLHDAATAVFRSLPERRPSSRMDGKGNPVHRQDVRDSNRRA